MGDAAGTLTKAKGNISDWEPCVWGQPGQMSVGQSDFGVFLMRLSTTRS